MQPTKLLKHSILPSERVDLSRRSSLIAGCGDREEREVSSVRLSGI
jgi:hypothetical protein